MDFKLLTEQHLQFLSLKGGCTGSSESTLVKMPHCWKFHVTANFKNTKQTTRKQEYIKQSSPVADPEGVHSTPPPPHTHHPFFNILWKKLVPNYFIFMGYLRKMR